MDLPSFLAGAKWLAGNDPFAGKWSLEAEMAARAYFAETWPEAEQASADPRDAEIADLKLSVIAFAAPWAERYGRELLGGPSGLMHPDHYDLLARCGARMDDFTRAVLPPCPIPAHAVLMPPALFPSDEEGGA